jgi:hypothetical protein
MPWLLLRLLTTTRCGSSETSDARLGGSSSAAKAPKLSSTASSPIALAARATWTISLSLN